MICSLLSRCVLAWVVILPQVASANRFFVAQGPNGTFLPHFPGMALALMSAIENERGPAQPGATGHWHLLLSDIKETTVNITRIADFLVNQVVKTASGLQQQSKDTSP
ncbi:MAG: hypothetical protein HQM05_13215, partial [Magnetococcales bacterium]|nr:hypothetical protein [Magnetococcales bacterium]